MNAERGTNRFVVKAWLRSEQLPFIPCSTDDEAMQAAFALFDEHGRDLQVELHWNDRPQYGLRRMAQFYAQHMRDRHNAFATR
jgi:cytosine/adenosine deaminase-related metal-dependent hydrolase